MTRNLEDRSGTGNGSPSRNGSGNRVVSRSAGKRSPPPDKNEKKVLACSGKSTKEEKQNGSSVQACDRMNNHVDSASLQSEQQQQQQQEAVATNIINNTNSIAHGGGEKLSFEVVEWPRIYISLSRKEKEDDFLAMKGTKLPQRPKKRAKNVDRTLQVCMPLGPNKIIIIIIIIIMSLSFDFFHAPINYYYYCCCVENLKVFLLGGLWGVFWQYCFPGMWLSDLTRNRYEVREKKCVKKVMFCFLLLFLYAINI